MYWKIGPVIKFGVNKIQTYHTYPEVYCLNKVSKKTAEALRKLKKKYLKQKILHLKRIMIYFSDKITQKIL